MAPKLPKAEVSVDYSYARFAAIDFTTRNYEFYRAYNLNGGGGSVGSIHINVRGIAGEP